MKAKIKFLSNESSIAAYCIIMIIYSIRNIGATKIFWIYLSFAVILTFIHWYSVYSSDEENKTYSFYQFDSLAIGLFLLTIFFDSKYKFINFELDSLSLYFLVIGIMLIIPKLFKNLINIKKTNAN